jgi:hypothetical protein
MTRDGETGTGCWRPAERRHRAPAEETAVLRYESGFVATVHPSCRTRAGELQVRHLGRQPRLKRSQTHEVAWRRAGPRARAQVSWHWTAGLGGCSLASRGVVQAMKAVYAVSADQTGRGARTSERVWSCLGKPTHRERSRSSSWVRQQRSGIRQLAIRIDDHRSDGGWLAARRCLWSRHAPGSARSRERSRGLPVGWPTRALHTATRTWSSL